MSLHDRLAATPTGARGLAAARLRYELLRALHDAVEACGGQEAFAKTTGVRTGRVRRVLDGDGNVRINLLADWLHAAGYELMVRLVPAGAPRRAALEERAEVERLRRELAAVTKQCDEWHEEAEAMLAPTEWGTPGMEWAWGEQRPDGTTVARDYPMSEVQARHYARETPGAVLLRREHTAWHRWPLDEEEADRLAPE